MGLSLAPAPRPPCESTEDARPATILRFSLSERLLHWAVALPYLVLLGSGSLLLLHRAVGWPALDKDQLRGIHEITGYVLVGLVFLALWGGDWRTFGRLARDLLTVRRRDFLWTFRMPLHALGFPVEMPPTGRFNAGQKVNALVQFVALVGLTVTGFLILWRPGSLAIWWLHVGFFASSLPLLLVHLYMALLHPDTRPALRGIFTGRVSRAWAREHHDEWVERAEEPCLCPRCGQPVQP